MNRWSMLWVCAVSGCGNQFEPGYELAGTWSFAEFNNTNGPRCDEGFLSLVQSDLSLDGKFPEFNTQQTEEGTVDYLGSSVPIVIYPASDLNQANAEPVDPEAFATAEDGTEWQILYVHFEAKQSCGECKDEVTVELNIKDTTCTPWPIFRR